MAKAPKAPGQNGATTVNQFISYVTPLLGGVGDGYWRGHVASNLVAPIAALAGEEAARPLLEHVEKRYLAQALARIAEALARNGKADDARRVLAEAVAILERSAPDGEDGTFVWHAVACARHALGDADECDLALAKAEACAKRERGNPTQPWPHLCVACARTGRFDTLLRLLQRLPQEESLSFDHELAARIALSSMVERGDVETFARYFEWLEPHNGYVLLHGILEGVEGALRAGNHEALAQIITRLAGLSYYGSAGGADIVRRIAAAGDVALARRCAGILRERGVDTRRELADALADLGEREESERMHARCAGERTPHPMRTFEAFAPVIRAVNARSPEEARAMLVAAESEARGLDALTSATELGVVGIGWLAVDKAHAETVLRDAADRALTLPKTFGSYQRGEVPKWLGIHAADAGAWATALLLLRKSSSKFTKSNIAKRLCRCYALAGDLEGAWMILCMMPPDSLHLAMSACDLLCERASMPTPYTNYA